MHTISEGKDGVYIVHNGKLIEVQSKDAECFRKAIVRGQPTFTIVAQDACAIETIVHWQGLVREGHPGSPKLKQADDDIAVFTEWQDTHLNEVKMPD